MKLLKSIILCGAAALSLTSCNDWLDVNTNPDTPSAESTLYQQRLAHIEFYTNSATQFAAWRNAFACGEWTRYYGGGTYQNMSYWYPTTSIVTTPYQWWFVGAMANVDDMYNKALADGNYIYAGVAKVIRAHGMMLMTDLYGEMPYAEACVGTTALPKYDTGKTIYLGCLSELDEGIELLGRYGEVPADKPALTEGDYYCNGDVTKWIKYANLLKARWLVKLSKKAAGSYKDGKYDADAILAALNNAMQSNADNVIINHTDDNSKTHDVLGWDEPVDYSPLYSVSGMNAGYYVTRMLYDNLTNFAGCGIEDPRAGNIIPWAYSQRSADTPAEIKWSDADGNDVPVNGFGWRRSMGVDMASDINVNKGPLRASYGVNKKETDRYGWWIDSDDANRWGDTIYVEQTSESKGYAAKADLLYRRGGVAVENSKESGTFYTRVSSPTYLGTYAECCFIKAEVLFKKGDKAGAFAAYKAGVKASMEQMNVKLNAWIAEDPNLAKCPSFVPMEQTAIDNYCNNALGTSGNITLGKIMTQKRIAMFFSMEMWNDMRRYDYNPEIFLGWSRPKFWEYSTGAQQAVPEGKQFRRWKQCSHETNYNAANLNEIGKEVPGAKYNEDYKTNGIWNAELDAWTINVWWDSTQE